MPEFARRLKELLATPVGALEAAASVVVVLCVGAVLLSVAVDFIEYGRRAGVKRKQRSVVATGSMLLFLALCSVMISGRIGAWTTAGLSVRLPLALAGLAALVLGAAANIAGRVRLGRQWANQVVIYEDHQLVTGGVYRWVRHPLYASLVLMLAGSSLVYANGAALAADLLVFLPFMAYRARQEEAALEREFPAYADYRRRVGMFFPKPWFFMNDNTSPAEVSAAAFFFCRYTVAAVLWAGYFLRRVELVAAVFAVLALSAALGIRRAPLVWLYSRTLDRWRPSRRVLLDVRAMRFAHTLGAAFGLACLALLLLPDPRPGWSATFVFGLLKTVSAVGLCPAYKLFTCLTSGGACCAFLRKKR